VTPPRNRSPKGPNRRALERRLVAAEADVKLRLAELWKAEERARELREKTNDPKERDAISARVIEARIAHRLAERVVAKAREELEA
jgi:hypothetical protein